MLKIRDREYEQFTPPERINLTVAALARGDFQEAERLWDTCQKYHYNAHDLDYSIRIAAFTVLNMAFREKCLIHYHQIKMIENRILHLECFIDREDTITRVKNLEEAQDLQLAMLKAVYAGMEHFCVDVGLCYDDFLKTAFICKS